MGINLNQIIIPNTGIRNWLDLYGTKDKNDYGMEYLTAIRSGIITQHPAGLSLNPNVLGSDLEDRIAEDVYSTYGESSSDAKKRIMGRSSSITIRWNDGTIPPSIKALLALRDNGIDILNPVPYDDSKTDADGIPLSLKKLDAIAYLTAVAIVAGNIGQSYQVAINYPARELSRDDMLNRMKKYFPDFSGNKDGINLFSYYGRLLFFLGMDKGPLRDSTFDQLGVGYLMSLLNYMRGHKAGGNSADYEHARNVLEGFVDGVIEHRFRPSESVAMIDLPSFTDKDTSKNFTDLFVNALKIVHPTDDFHARLELHHNKGTNYYRGRILFR